MVHGDGSILRTAERRALSLFPRETSVPGNEWVVGSPTGIKGGISALLGDSVSPTPVAGLRPYDDWRDWVRPKRSVKPRRIWVGFERQTGRLKVVHSPHISKFYDFCPTYSRYGIDWREVWGWPDGLWHESPTLHPMEGRMVDLWSDLVTRCGFGPADGRVGWLRERTDIADVHAFLQAGGLVEENALNLR
ncbi:MAG: hypothetical protein AB7O80_04240 [Acetobacteraceae bacterium]